MALGFDENRTFSELSFEFVTASTEKKFLVKVSDHLKSEYGVQPTSSGKKALYAMFNAIADNRRNLPTVVLGVAVIQKLVEELSRPIRTLH